MSLALRTARTFWLKRNIKWSAVWPARLPPGRYVGLPEEEDDFNFEEGFTALKAEFEEQLKEEARLNEIISANLSKIKMKQ